MKINIPIFDTLDNKLDIYGESDSFINNLVEISNATTYVLYNKLLSKLKNINFTYSLQTELDKAIII